MITNILTQVDGYKVGHKDQYPEGTELVYSNWTPRGSRLSGVDKVVFFGLRHAINKLIVEGFGHFFASDKELALKDYKRRIDFYLGPDAISVDHIRELHDLGYLPVEIRALPEGTLTPLGVPMFTIENTLPEFFWITNMLETMLSATLWLPCTSATIAYRNRKLLDEYAEKTGANTELVPFLAHDFSMRGMTSIESAAVSGAAHLLSSLGTDTLPAIDLLESDYDANVESEMVGVSVPATEHSVMCMGSEAGEIETFRRLITQIYPSGIVSIVSDTWDFWQVINEFLPELKSEIMAREGKLVIRPDSGDPVKILCGDASSVEGTPEFKGLVECLWGTFGGTTNDKGYKTLDAHIGAIYGDSITYERMGEILNRLKRKGFTSDNVVFGVGSFTYQYNTRDTFNFAMKATAGKVNGEYREIYKDPKTGDGSKKSALGFIRVDMVEGELVAAYPVSHEQSKQGKMNLVYDGSSGIVKKETLSDIRKTLHGA